MSKYGVISGPYLPVFEPEITSYLDTFHAVPVSDGYIKEESFMVFIHDKLRDSVDISKVVAAEQFSYILKLFRVHYTYLKHYGNSNLLLRINITRI